MLNQKGFSSAIIILAVLAFLGIGFFAGATTQKSFVSTVSKLIKGPEAVINPVPETTSKSTLKSVGNPSSTKPFINPINSPTATTGRFSDTSDPNALTFIKVISPNGGESFKVGDTMRITWDANNLNKDGSCVVTLVYNTGQHPRYGETQRGSRWASVNTPNRFFDWELDSDSGGRQVKVEMECYDSNSNNYLDRSDNYFTVEN